jgi:hypothetical protein
MWISRRLTLIGVAAAIGISCGDGGGGPSTSELLGTWNATRAEFVSMANPATKAEIVAAGGTVQLVLEQTKAFTFTITTQGDPPWVLGGAWSVSSDVLTLTYTSGLLGESQFDISLSGDVLTLTRGHVGFDFDGNGVREEAMMNMDLARQ